jgi:hypothetical protein
MAKGKHSPALFEVVHGKKHFDKPETVLRTPNWWFKGRHRGPATGPVDPGDPPSFSHEADPTQPALPPPPVADPAPAEYESAVEDPTAFAMPHPARKGTPFQFVVDRDRQELFLRVRFTAAIIAGFALVVVVGLAYLTGRHFGRGPATALATQSSEEIAAGPIEKGVMDVGSRTASAGSRGAITPGGGPGIGAGGVSSQPAPNRITEASVLPPGASATSSRPTGGRSAGPSVESRQTVGENGRRIVGWQYVVIQSYAGDQKKLADEACEFMVKNGVPCTVEKGVAGWPANWNTVVSMQGFERASGPQYEAYIGRAVKLGETFAGRSAWKRFEPTPVRWKETN